MSMNDVVDYIKRQIAELEIRPAELARRAVITRAALQKIFNGDVQRPEVITLVNLAYALDEHPYKLISMYLAGTSAPNRFGRKVRDRKDHSRFIRDVTIPDGEIVRVNQRFKKIWEIANGGNTLWVGRKLVCQDQNSLLFRKIDANNYVPLNYFLIPTKTEIEIPITEPNKAIILEVEFIAPESPGAVISYWKMVDQDGNLCFPGLNGLRCQVNVQVL